MFYLNFYLVWTDELPAFNLWSYHSGQIFLSSLNRSSVKCIRQSSDDAINMCRQPPHVIKLPLTLSVFVLRLLLSLQWQVQPMRTWCQRLCQWVMTGSRLSLHSEPVITTQTEQWSIYSWWGSNKPLCRMLALCHCILHGVLTVPVLQGIPAEASDLPPQEHVRHSTPSNPPTQTAQQPRQPQTASNSKSIYIYLC